jgi:L-alanine-DL-glutamate epimerase-like enolase superfamily enzyme
MKLVHLRSSRIDIPFRQAFAHAAAHRSETESVWVETRAACGTTDHGEGCPRVYVTGEDVASARRFFERHAADCMGEVHSLDDLRRYAAIHRQDIDANPAAFAAVELALLDALGRSSGRSIEALLGMRELDGEPAYTAVIGDGSLAHFCTQLEVYRTAGLRDAKLKLSGDLHRDRAKLRLAQAQGMQLRLDANCLWDSVGDVCRYLVGLDVPVTAIEEPLTRDRHADLANLAARTGTRVVLDESLRTREQIDAIARWPHRFILNLRVSKLGGLLRSLAVLARARGRRARHRRSARGRDEPSHARRPRVGVRRGRPPRRTRRCLRSLAAGPGRVRHTAADRKLRHAPRAGAWTRLRARGPPEPALPRAARRVRWHARVVKPTRHPPARDGLRSCTRAGRDRGFTGDD